MKLYVGNLAYSVSEDALRELFSSYGEIEEVVIIKDKFSGNSKGFGFVTFKDDEAGNSAISALNGKEFEGRELKVNEAKPMDPDSRPPRRDNRFGGGGRGGSGGPRRSFGGSGGRNGGGQRRRF